MQKFVVNGKTYSDPSEMPPEIRQAYEKAMGALADKDGNGIPDILEGLQQPGTSNVVLPTLNFTTTQFVVDGKTYSNLDDLPPELQEKYARAKEKAAQAMVDANQNGIPDILENGLAGQGITATQVEAATNAEVMQSSTGPVVSEVTGMNGKGMRTAGIVIGVLLIVVLILGAMVMLQMLR